MTDYRNEWVAALAFELAPAAIFNFAVAFAVASAMRQSGFGEFAAVASVAAGIAAFLLAWIALRGVDRRNGRFTLAGLDQSTPEVGLIERAADAGELLLTQRIAAPPAEQQFAADELLLDDILASATPDSRVVRLFVADGIPTAGELQERIDRHLRSAIRRGASPDASQELHDAILALRQSLR